MQLLMWTNVDALPELQRLIKIHDVHPRSFVCAILVGEAPLLLQESFRSAVSFRSGCNSQSRDRAGLSLAVVVIHVGKETDSDDDAHLNLNDFDGNYSASKQSEQMSEEVELSEHGTKQRQRNARRVILSEP